MKSKLDSFIDTMIAVQIVNYFTDINIGMPANTQIWFEELNHFLNFNHMNINGVCKLYDEDFELKTFLEGKQKELITSEDEEVSFTDDNIVYLTLLIGGAVAIPLIAIGYLALKHKREFIKNKIHQSISKYFWNGHINTFKLFFTKQQHGIHNQISLKVHNPKL